MRQTLCLYLRHIKEFKRGPKAPLFFAMELEKTISKIIADNLLSPSHFVVAINTKSNNGGLRKISVLIDADEGIDIDSIAKYTRIISSALDEINPFNTPYELEVSSPGVDYPLSGERMFKKNVGRTLQITLDTSDVVSGKLLSYNEGKILIEAEVKQKKKTVKKYELEILESSISKAIVQVTF